MKPRMIAIACLMIAAFATNPTASAQSGPAVPANLQPPSGHSLLFKAFASGVQIYTCAAKPDDANAFVWTFKAPEATLWNIAGEKIGTHFAGPTWEGSDGSAVVAESAARADAPDAGAIPWLLLRAKSNSGSGLFSNVSYVQRLQTVAGNAPATGCSRANAGAELRVAYMAVYAFFA